LVLFFRKEQRKTLLFLKKKKQKDFWTHAASAAVAGMNQTAAESFWRYHGPHPDHV
jgi:hypothetical protein